jgi:hypothetical protein
MLVNALLNSISSYVLYSNPPFNAPDSFWKKQSAEQISAKQAQYFCKNLC